MMGDMMRVEALPWEWFDFVGPRERVERGGVERVPGVEEGGGAECVEGDGGWAGGAV